MATKKSAKAKTTTKPVKDICFTIMPFGGWLDDYYINIYSHAIRNAGLEPKRADDLFRPSTIVQDIWNYTQQAKVILADLTGKNPNVFYELGLAHALAKPAILITQSMDDVPFDLRALRVIEYDKNAPDWGNILKTKIENSIRETLAAPLSSVLPAFLDVKEESKTKISQADKDLLEIKQELDSLRREFITNRRNISLESRENKIDIGPTEARAMIRTFINQKMPLGMIIDRVSSLGPPVSWVEDEIQKIRMASKRVTKKVSKKVK
jgi:hypothetical protein